MYSIDYSSPALAYPLVRDYVVQVSYFCVALSDFSYRPLDQL
jgi:hypothetical protein